MKVQEADEFQVFFLGDETRFFPEFPDGALRRSRVFCGLIKVSRPGGRESKVS